MTAIFTVDVNHLLATACHPRMEMDADNLHHILAWVWIFGIVFISSFATCFWGPSPQKNESPETDHGVNVKLFLNHLKGVNKDISCIFGAHLQTSKCRFSHDRNVFCILILYWWWRTIFLDHFPSTHVTRSFQTFTSFIFIT